MYVHIRECVNKVLEEHQQLVEVSIPDASIIPIPESQPATPPVSPLVLTYSPVSPGVEADYAEQLDNIHMLRIRINPDSHQIYIQPNPPHAFPCGTWLPRHGVGWGESLIGIQQRYSTEVAQGHHRGIGSAI